MRRSSSRWLSLPLLAMAGLTCWIPAHAMQADGHAPDGGALFASDKPLAITIKAAWKDLVRKKSDPTQYPATLEFSDDRGQSWVLAITVERRGLARQKVCSFPPIKLRFKDKAAKGSAFAGEKSLKMVTHCGKGDRWEQYYIKEMLAYRIYNAMTERSFRVRPLSVTYVDSKSNDSDGPHFAFLIEDDGDVAKRNHLKKTKLAEIQPAQLEPLDDSRQALFQYLIGNTDWSALSGPSDKCCHNSVLMGKDGDARTGIVAVPYDFDASGLVDASYAMPAESLRSQNVSQRVYRGFCVHNASLEPARDEYLRKEQTILGIIAGEGRLDARNREDALRYAGKFFDTLRSPREFASEVTGKCRK